MRLRYILIWSVLVTGAAATIFALKYEVQNLEERLSFLNAQIVKDQEAIHVLRAEWSYLNRPAALEKVAKEYLTLEPITALRMGAVDKIPERELVPSAETDPIIAPNQNISRQMPAPLNTTTPSLKEDVVHLGLQQ